MADEDDEVEEDEPGGDPGDEDFDDDEDDEDGEGGAKKGGKRKLLIIGGAVLLLLIAGGGGVFYLGLLDEMLGIEEEETGIIILAGKVFYKLEDITLNLNAEGPKSRFLKLGLTLVLLKEEDIVKIEALIPRIVDNVTAYMRELKPEEMAGSANFYRVRENLLMRVQVAVAPVKVTNILFNSALIQ